MEREVGRRGESGRHKGLTGEDAGVDIRVCWNREDVSGRGKEKTGEGREARDDRGSDEWELS